MGYIRSDDLGNITYYSDGYSADTIEIHNDELCLQIKSHISDYKFINDEIVYRPRTSLYDAWNGSAWIRSEDLVLNAKEEVWEKIKLFRDEHKYKGIKVTSEGTIYWVHSDYPSRIQHLGLVLAVVMHVFKTIFNLNEFESFPANLQWKTMQSNNMGEPIWMLVTWVIAMKMFAADITLESQCFMRAEQHRYAMIHSTDPYNYNYTTGWPEVYGG